MARSMPPLAAIPHLHPSPVTYTGDRFHQPWASRWTSLLEGLQGKLTWLRWSQPMPCGLLFDEQTKQIRAASASASSSRRGVYVSEVVPVWRSNPCAGICDRRRLSFHRYGHGASPADDGCVQCGGTNMEQPRTCLRSLPNVSGRRTLLRHLGQVEASHLAAVSPMRASCNGTCEMIVSSRAGFAGPKHAQC